MSYYRSLLKRFTKSYANHGILSIPTQDLRERFGENVVNLDIGLRSFIEWVDEFFPNASSQFGTKEHKKMLELYISWKLLDIMPNDVYMDAAGGKFSYISKLNCKEKIMQDINFAEELKSSVSDDVKFLMCPGDAIDMRDGTVDKISCHHSIEHFQQDADTGFIIEVQRLLSIQGKCVIIPLFVSDQHYLITDRRDFHFWNEPGSVITDLTAGLPGGERSGNFARVYGLDTLKSRVLDTIDETTFGYKVHIIRLDGTEIPNPSHFHHSNQAKVNLSYRALEIWRR